MKTIAIYPGTFDPITNGHIDLIKRAASIFPKVIVLVAANTKKECLFTLDERVEMISTAVEKCPGKIVVVPFHGLLIDAVKEHSSKLIIRGLRAVSDFEYESQMALMNRRLDNSIETFFMISSEAYAYLSSSFVKEIAGLGGDVSSMIPPGAVDRLRQHFSKI